MNHSLGDPGWLQLSFRKPWKHSLWFVFPARTPARWSFLDNNETRKDCYTITEEVFERQLVRRRTWLARWRPAHLKLQLKNVWGQTVSFIFRLSQRLCGDLSLLIHHWQEQEVTVCQRKRVYASRASKLCRTLPSSGRTAKTNDTEWLFCFFSSKNILTATN